MEMRAPYIEIDPEGILIPPSATELGSGTTRASLWHIVDDKTGLTWCGLFLSPGTERRPFSETPEQRRCETCIKRFGENVVQFPQT
jgi:hypothetical protein